MTENVYFNCADLFPSFIPYRRHTDAFILKGRTASSNSHSVLFTETAYGLTAKDATWIHLLNVLCHFTIINACLIYCLFRINSSEGISVQHWVTKSKQTLNATVNQSDPIMRASLSQDGF